eukprot:3306467-Pyramimonas_sp.AAC.1
MAVRERERSTWLLVTKNDASANNMTKNDVSKQHDQRIETPLRRSCHSWSFLVICRAGAAAGRVRGGGDEPSGHD